MTIHEMIERYGEGEAIQVVGFRLCGEEFAVPILTVREINHRPQITTVPHSPPEVVGMTDLRGNVIAVVDLAMRFGMPIEQRGHEERMVVLDVGSKPVGFLVDAVTQVRRVEVSAIDQAPTTSSAGAAEYIWGIAKLTDRLIILLDPRKLVNAEELPTGMPGGLAAAA